MSNIRVQGNPSGSGTLTIASPNTNSDFTLNLPASGGTVLVDGATQSPTFNAVTATSVATTSATTTTLAVAGNNISAVNSLGFRNRIINGAMGIWQRGTSGFASGAYCADRWVGINTTTVAQSSDTPSSAFYFSLEFANTSATFPLALQRIESVNAQDLVGQQVTLSFWAKNISGSAILYCELNYPNAKDNFGSITAIQAITASASPSSSWTYYTVTFNALPSQVANGLEVRIVRSNASAATTRITGVQLEAGSVATPFERRDYGRELIMCQRYYEKSYDSNIPPGTATSAGRVDMPTNSSASTSYYVPTTVQFKVTKRTQGSIRFWDQAGNLSRVTDYSAGGLVRTDARNSVWGVASGDTSFYLINTQNAASFSSFQWDASAEL